MTSSAYTVMNELITMIQAQYDSDIVDKSDNDADAMAESTAALDIKMPDGRVINVQLYTTLI